MQFVKISTHKLRSPGRMTKFKTNVVEERPYESQVKTKMSLDAGRSTSQKHNRPQARAAYAQVMAPGARVAMA
tara:strand:- start:561 stop:779 length:219 start_codon:yes stop_codon:yes gene_type:complete